MVTKIRIDMLPAGLNGDEGLIRQNFHSAKKVKETLRLLGSIPKHQAHKRESPG